ncbi:MAG: leucine-rich repeat domain-containing protein, partial [Clostridium paraputrificum]
IGDNAFSTSTLKRIDIPTKIEDEISGKPWGASNAIIYWKGVVDAKPFIFNTLTKKIIRYIGEETDIEIPSEITIGDQVYGVEHIGQNAFRDNRTITSMKIPDNIISIEDGAFKGTSSLTNVTLGNGLETIGGSAFESSGITSIEIPDSVTSIGNNA